MDRLDEGGWWTVSSAVWRSLERREDCFGCIGDRVELVRTEPIDDESADFSAAKTVH
jgi:hypothetical protein